MIANELEAPPISRRDSPLGFPTDAVWVTITSLAFIVKGQGKQFPTEKLQLPFLDSGISVLIAQDVKNIRFQAHQRALYYRTYAQ